MSRQLAISSAFASFAMAAMALAYTPSGSSHADGQAGGFGLKAGQNLPGPPGLPTFTG